MFLPLQTTLSKGIPRADVEVPHMYSKFLVGRVSGADDGDGVGDS